tara:strand:+ start:64 stop:654 length:591 start_codon:yes stop_codon:yes gene_type:complete
VEFTLPELPYAYDALEPHYDTKTLEIHHTKHHAGYVKGLNNAIAKLAEARDTSNYSLIKHWERELSFHGAGHKLHSLFWQNMRPGKEDNKPSEELLAKITKWFGSFEKFTEQFIAATASIEGSGWGALVHCRQSDALTVLQVENHQKLLLPGLNPILVCDVWEHAYYLKYQNRRKEWVQNFMKLINWDEVERRCNE